MAEGSTGLDSSSGEPLKRVAEFIELRTTMMDDTVDEKNAAAVEGRSCHFQAEHDEDENRRLLEKEANRLVDIKDKSPGLESSCTADPEYPKRTFQTGLVEG